MTLHFSIKNFGKIKSADLSLDHLVIFVGNNNSGKTMLMQLIYGIREELRNLPVPISGAKISDSTDQVFVRCDTSWFREMESQINNYLAENKTELIEKLFGTAIPIEEIRISLKNAETTYFVCSIYEQQMRKETETTQCININTLQYENNVSVKSYDYRHEDWNPSNDAIEEALRVVWRIILSEQITSDSGQLFLPASRSGLQLLYKQYFATESYSNLVMPIKDFLRFLQLYTENKQPSESQRNLLEFGEECLLQGKIVQKEDETFYIDKHMDRPISLHIASSMIHELTPFIKALSATQQIRWLYCDEVENSLHPLLQGEMARWLIRMANAGMHVMISSHSDTMASRFNNLLMLTHLKQINADYETILRELNLKNADLLRLDITAGVYEFRSDEHGKTIVERLEFNSHPLMGYGFELFGSNLDKLYHEAERITR